MNSWSSSSALKWKTTIAAFGAAAVLTNVACTSENGGFVTAKLEISEAGAYTLDGTPVQRAELKYVLRAKRPENGTLLLHLVVSPSASFEAVGHAMQAAQFSGAQVGIVGNEKF